MAVGNIMNVAYPKILFISDGNMTGSLMVVVQEIMGLCGLPFQQ